MRATACTPGRLGPRFWVILLSILGTRVPAPAEVVQGPRPSQRVVEHTAPRRALPVALDTEGGSGTPVPGRLVVRYRHDVDACVHCLLAREVPLARAGGRAELDRLNAELGVHGAEALFFHRHGMTGAQARAAFAARVATLAARSPARRARMRPEAVPDLSHVYELRLSEDVDVREAARCYAADPAVVYAHPVWEARVDWVPNDPFFATTGTWGQSYADLWGLHAIGSEAAWDVSLGAGAVVAVVDTGVDRTHPDLAANMWTNPGEIPANGVDDDGNGFVDDVRGWDFDTPDADPTDEHGHGTHVAGTAAAVGSNGIGVVGVAPGARIMAVQGLGADGRGYTSRLAEAIVYAAENGADVINNSWGGFGLAESLYDAIVAADALGSVVVSAAGNDARSISGLLWLPAGHPLGLTVGATAPDGTLAGFSNFGPQQSLVAPGSDVLSTVSARTVFDSSLRVGGQYMRLSGTSMATPHASGAAALVVAAEPSLTPAEVRWHLELNADQPGFPGWEGLIHNPVFGYGRLSADRAFDTPPATTRLTPPGIREWHAFPEVGAVPGLPASFLFTSLDPVAWSIDAPPWLRPGAAAGSGASALALEIDGAGLAPATYQGDVSVLAPGAVDGGAAFSTTVDIHADGRVGAPVVLDQNGYATILGYAPDSASNPAVTLAAWNGWGENYGLYVAALDGAGIVSGPVRVIQASVRDITVATDGHGFLLAWYQFAGSSDEIRIARVGADGQLLDTAPPVLVSKRDSNCSAMDMSGAAHDGQSWVLLVSDVNYCKGSSKLFLYRVYPDGSFGKRRRLYKLSRAVSPEFACQPGRCLLAWMDPTVEQVDPDTGKYVRSAWALPVVGDVVEGVPTKIVTDTYYVVDLATDGTSYLALSQRYFFCARGDLCRTEVIATRVAPSGAPLDADAIVVSNAAPAERVYPWPTGVTFTGPEWVVSYGLSAVSDSPFEDGSYVFVNRLDQSGAVLESEHIGLLVDATGRASESRVSATATHTVVLWEDGRFDAITGPYGHPLFSAHLAQRILARAPGAAFPERPIGSIGPQAVGEDQLLRLRLTAPGLDPAATTFALSGAPPGVLLDTANGLFQWRPGGDQAGAHVVHVEATAGGTTVAEDVSVTVTERVRSVSGLVRLADGTPVAGAALKVRGTVDKRRTAYTDAAGRYRVEGFPPGVEARIKITRPTSKSYRADSAVSVLIGSVDLQAPDHVVAPR